MKYIEHDIYHEMIPETSADVEFLKREYGYDGKSESWCVAKPPGSAEESRRCMVRRVATRSGA